MVLSSLPIIVMASEDNRDDNIRSMNSLLDDIGVEMDLNIGISTYQYYKNRAYDDVITLMPALRLSSQETPLAIYSKCDIDILLSALEIMFRYTEESIHVDGAIIRALNDAGLREYWRDSIRDLFNVHNRASYADISPLNGWWSPIQRQTFSPWLITWHGNHVHGNAIEFEYLINYRFASSSGDTFLDTGYDNFSTGFRLGRMYRVTASWQVAHGVIIPRTITHSGMFALRNFGVVSIEVSGSLTTHW